MFESHCNCYLKLLWLFRVPVDHILIYSRPLWLMTSHQMATPVSLCVCCVFSLLTEITSLMEALRVLFWKGHFWNFIIVRLKVIENWYLGIWYYFFWYKTHILSNLFLLIWSLFQRRSSLTPMSIPPRAHWKRFPIIVEERATQCQLRSNSVIVIILRLKRDWFRMSSPKSE